MELIDAIFDGEPAQVDVVAHGANQIVMTANGHSIGLTRAEVRRLIYMLSCGHARALELEAELIKVNAHA